MHFQGAVPPACLPTLCFGKGAQRSDHPEGASPLEYLSFAVSKKDVNFERIIKKGSGEKTIPSCKDKNLFLY